LHRSLTYGF